MKKTTSTNSLLAAMIARPTLVVMLAFSSILLFSLMSPSVHATEAVVNEPKVSFWQMVRNKIERIVPKKKVKIETVAGGVRGSIADATDLYWAGDVDIDVAEDELSAFKAAVALFDAGDMPAAKRAFGDFAKSFPESALAQDARNAVEQITLAK